MSRLLRDLKWICSATLLSVVVLHSGAAHAAFPGQGLQEPRLGDGFWSAQGTNFVDANGRMVRFSGVIWSGFESQRAVVGGLDLRTYANHFDQMKELGFNALRLPFAGDTLLRTTMPIPAAIAANPDLKGLSSLEIMDKIIQASGERGIKVILDYHRMHLTADSEQGTWWDNNTSEQVWLDNWAMLAQRYQGNPTVIGADLFNEVHSNKTFPEGAPYWEAANLGPDKEKYNYRSATMRAIAAIQAQNPDWIIFVGCMYQDYWWGGNCVKVLQAPIVSPKNKLAYTVHEYGPFVYNQTWFSSPLYPRNLPTIYERFWGLVIDKKVAPLWMGEFGSKFPLQNDTASVKEREAFIAQIEYMKTLGVSWTVAFWGPDTKDTGSILMPDWRSVNAWKMRLLKPIMHRGFK